MNSSAPTASLVNWSNHAKVAWLDGPGNLVWRREMLPTTCPDGAHLCETVISAISPGSELAQWKGLPSLGGRANYPRTQGYCNVARVIASGSNTCAAIPGDLVLSFTSHRDRFVSTDADILQVLPQGLNPEHGSVAYLFHLGYDAIIRSNIRPGSRVLVIGLGALGLASVAWAHFSGARVTAVSEHQVQQDIARSFGAIWAGKRSDSAQREEALERCGADVVIVATNGWGDWQLALSSVAKRGTIAVLGHIGRGEPLPDFNPLDSNFLYNRQVRIQYVGEAPERMDSRNFLRFNERDNLRFILQSLESGRFRADRMISGKYPANQLEQAYSALELRNGSPVTFVLQW